MRKKALLLLFFSLIVSGCMYTGIGFHPPGICWPGGGYFSKYNILYDDLPIELTNQEDKDVRECFNSPEDHVDTYHCMLAKGYKFYHRSQDGTCQNICLSDFLNEAEKKAMCHNVSGRELRYFFGMFNFLDP